MQDDEGTREPTAGACTSPQRIRSTVGRTLRGREERTQKRGQRAGVGAARGEVGGEKSRGMKNR